MLDVVACNSLGSLIAMFEKAVLRPHTHAGGYDILFIVTTVYPVRVRSAAVVPKKQTFSAPLWRSQCRDHASSRPVVSQNALCVTCFWLTLKTARSSFTPRSARNDYVSVCYCCWSVFCLFWFSLFLCCYCFLFVCFCFLALSVFLCLSSSSSSFLAFVRVEYLLERSDSEDQRA